MYTPPRDLPSGVEGKIIHDIQLRQNKNQNKVYHTIVTYNGNSMLGFYVVSGRIRLRLEERAHAHYPKDVFQLVRRCLAPKLGGGYSIVYNLVNDDPNQNFHFPNYVQEYVKHALHVPIHRSETPYALASSMWEEPAQPEEALPQKMPLLSQKEWLRENCPGLTSLPAWKLPQGFRV